MLYTLHLTLKKRYFDLIKDGVKTEEYREVKRHWIARILRNLEYLQDLDGVLSVDPIYRKFEKVEFRNGYDSTSPTITMECKDIKLGKGKPEWGAKPDQTYFVIKLGRELDRYNC